jgi:hypothetical protein
MGFYPNGPRGAKIMGLGSYTLVNGSTHFSCSSQCRSISSDTAAARLPMPLHLVLRQRPLLMVKMSEEKMKGGRDQGLSRVVQMSGWVEEGGAGGVGPRPTPGDVVQWWQRRLGGWLEGSATTYLRSSSSVLSPSSSVYFGVYTFLMWSFMHYPTQQKVGTDGEGYAIHLYTSAPPLTCDGEEKSTRVETQR